MTSSLLIDEPPLQVLPSLAVRVGLNEALILQQIHYWLKIKQTDPARYADSHKQGAWWVYNSVREWQEQFPFWSEKTIERALASLKSQGILRVERLAPDSWDRTNWYTIQYERLQALTQPPPPAEPIPTKEGNPFPQSDRMHSDKMAERIPPKCEDASAQNEAMHSGKTGPCLISETSSKTTQRLPQKAAPPPGDLPAASGEKAQEKAPDKSGGGGASDPLDALDAAGYAALEAQARAQLVAETGPPVSLSLLHGKSLRLVKQRMRALLSVPAPAGNPPPAGE